MGFIGKVVLITGAGSGIGADAARHLAKLGAKVSIVERIENSLNKVVHQIVESGASSPLAILADVTKDAERIVNETVKHFGKLDILINNAGIVLADNIVSIHMSEFDQILDTNVRSVIAITKLCVPHLEKTKGNIVNVSSISGPKPTCSLLSYCISKAALDQFTKCCALDLASKGIRVNAINPATIRTPIFEQVGLTPKQVDELMDITKGAYLVGRVGEVSDTSAAIAFLADDETASFFTGILLPVDGGNLISGKVIPMSVTSS